LATVLPKRQRETPPSRKGGGVLFCAPFLPFLAVKPPGGRDDRLTFAPQGSRVRVIARVPVEVPDVRVVPPVLIPIGIRVAQGVRPVQIVVRVAEA